MNSMYGNPSSQEHGVHNAADRFTYVASCLCWAPPGDALTTEGWKEKDGRYAIRASTDWWGHEQRLRRVDALGAVREAGLLSHSDQPTVL